MISISLETGKIDKAKLRKDNKGRTWLDVILIDTPNNHYGNDFMCAQGVSKEERQAGVRGAILGNGKVIGGESAASRRPTQQSGEPPAGPTVDPGVPF